MIRSADVRTPNDAHQWEARLNREWPQRTQVAAWIGAQVGANSASPPWVLELACGAGYLAEALYRQLPGIRYCGFDLSPHLLDQARRRLVGDECSTAKDGVMKFHCADLVRDSWTAEVLALGWMGKVDAVVSIQALHDLGGLGQQTKVLKRARELMRPGGLLAYGDLLLDDENPHSSRYSAAQHEEMLLAAGYSQDSGQLTEHRGVTSRLKGFATTRFGDFGCFACLK